MSTYCISDIHGELDRYRKMLDHIGFTDADTMYVIGDVIDRKYGGIAILRDIMARPNIHLLMGNHELMCVQALGADGGDTDAEMLWACNGSSVTREELEQLTAEEQKAIVQYLASLPDHADVVVEGSTFHLVHGFPAETAEGRVWKRVERESVSPYPPEEFVIVGHTPVCCLSEDMDRYFRDMTDNGGFMRIRCVNGNLFDIDCGCGNRTVTRRLACLRLDDFEEFYV